jgi:hypothetical protein
VVFLSPMPSVPLGQRDLVRFIDEAELRYPNSRKVDIVETRGEGASLAWVLSELTWSPRASRSRWANRDPVLTSLLRQPRASLGALQDHAIGNIV